MLASYLRCFQLVPMHVVTVVLKILSDILQRMDHISLFNFFAKWLHGKKRTMANFSPNDSVCILDYILNVVLILICGMYALAT